MSDGLTRGGRTSVELSDADLMKRVTVQDRSAFALLFTRYAPKIKSYYLGMRVAAPQAEDLMQEVMVTVWRRAASYDPGKALVSTWMFTIARNKFIDQVRKERRTEVLTDTENDQPADEPTPDEALNDGQRAAALEAAIKALPPDQTSVIVLSFMKEMSHSEIAAELDLPLGTVKSRIRLAMNRLRDELEWMR